MSAFFVSLRYACLTSNNCLKAKFRVAIKRIVALNKIAHYFGNDEYKKMKWDEYVKKITPPVSK